jgi:hypothetical protein
MTVRYKIPAQRAIAPPDYSTREGKDAVFALHAMAKGQANEGQQKSLLEWMVKYLCRTYELSYRPDEIGGDRETAFAEGRRYVGTQLVRIVTSTYDDMINNR